MSDHDERMKAQRERRRANNGADYKTHRRYLKLCSDYIKLNRPALHEELKAQAKKDVAEGRHGLGL